MAKHKDTAAEPVDGFGTPIDKEAAGGEAFLVVEGADRVASPDVEVIEPAVRDQVPVDPTVPDEASVALSVPTSIGGPLSSKALPNAHRDAAAIAIENGVLKEGGDLRAVRDVAAGPRGAYELAKLLEAHPEWINNLDQLDDLERAAGVKEPRAWVASPVDLLEEAHRYNFYFIGANGNQLINKVPERR